jgi:TolA-binding protein
LKKIKITLQIFVLLTSIVPPSINAQDQNFSSASLPIEQFGFANYLFVSQDYSLAALEYQRFIFNHPMDTLAHQAKYKLGLCYMGLKEWDKALATFKPILPKQNRYSEAALFHIGACYSQKGIAELARDNYKNLVRDYSGGTLPDDAQLMLALTFMDDEEWPEASVEFGNLHKQFPSSPMAPMAKQLALETLKGSDLPHRSVAASGLLSAIVPGAGQTWCGRTADGFFSLLLTGSFTYLAANAYQNNSETSAFVMGTLGFSFYMGNIYGAINSAKRYNFKHVDLFKTKINHEIEKVYN